MTEPKPYNPDIAKRDLKYYIFDWDDNILRMPTHIHLERRLGNGAWVPHLVSTSLFSVIRNDTKNYRPPGGNWEKAFVEFRDFAHDDESKFLKDAREAIDRRPERKRESRAELQHLPPHPRRRPHLRDRHRRAATRPAPCAKASRCSSNACSPRPNARR
ncbi:MAG: hypothetical protein ACOX6A_04140 [Atribacter sp.]|uniref:hypothetical protein n=1 Tax=Atribacter sp. TaxID=2847780 RepID=UPI003D96A186